MNSLPLEEEKQLLAAWINSPTYIKHTVNAVTVLSLFMLHRRVFQFSRERSVLMTLGVIFVLSYFLSSVGHKYPNVDIDQAHGLVLALWTAWTWAIVGAMDEWFGEVN